MQLTQKHAWNNFFQLKVIAICEEVLDHCENDEFKKFFLTNSNIGKSLADMALDSEFQMHEERKIRNGYMGLVVKIANKLQSKIPKADASEESQTAPTGASSSTQDQTVTDYLDGVGEDWKNFVDGELSESNENNSKTLGGTTRPANDDDDEIDQSYEV